jgi:hypothetical protein
MKVTGPASWAKVTADHTILDTLKNSWSKFWKKNSKKKYSKKKLSADCVPFSYNIVGFTTFEPWPVGGIFELFVRKLHEFWRAGMWRVFELGLETSIFTHLFITFHSDPTLHHAIAQNSDLFTESQQVQSGECSNVAAVCCCAGIMIERTQHAVLERHGWGWIIMVKRSCP